MNCQNKYDEALEIGENAVKYMNSGKFDEAIILLKQAETIDPTNIGFPYEMALAYSLKKDYKNAIKILLELCNREGANDLIFQLLGNCYDMSGKREKALDIYNEGLKLFPKSGRIYLEIGITKINDNNYKEALFFFEKGISVAPNFASNYYWASKVYFRTKYKLIGLIYGEIFMNLERIGARVDEISELLYIVYKNSVTTKDSLLIFDFNKNILYGDNVILDDTLINNAFIDTCNLILTSSLQKERVLDMNCFNKIRITFLKKYFINAFQEFPNILFDYQYNLYMLDHFEAYNYWLFKKGNQDEFGNWYALNKNKWEKFVDWFLRDPILIDPTRKFYSGQYKK